MANQQAEIVRDTAATLRRIYDERTAGDFTFEGVLAEMLSRLGEVTEVRDAPDAVHASDPDAVLALRDQVTRRAAEHMTRALMKMPPSSHVLVEEAEDDSEPTLRLADRTPGPRYGILVPRDEVTLEERK